MNIFFFNISDSTPIGRILNRVSKDVETADNGIYFDLRQIIVQIFRSIVAIGMISLQSVFLLLLIIPLVIVYYLIQKIYISTSRQLKRIDLTSRSPIYSHFSETIQGTSSIRAYSANEQFIKESNHRIDTNHKYYYQSLISSCWLGIRLEFVGYCIVFLASIFAVINKDTLSPGIAAISITNALSLAGIISFLVRTYTSLQTNFVSIERLIEYNSLPLEVLSIIFCNLIFYHWLIILG